MPYLKYSELVLVRNKVYLLQGFKEPSVLILNVQEGVYNSGIKVLAAFFGNDAYHLVKADGVFVAALADKCIYDIGKGYNPAEEVDFFAFNPCG
jgi:hypothetical protein